VVIARPVLGVLRFTGGKTVSLDKPVLVGRNPKLEGRMPNEMPHLVKLDVGQGLSRTHAIVRLEGWQVLLEDLNSANGTVVALPGVAPRRLHAGEPSLLEFGATIDFGGEISATFAPQ
jgi:pSer/pThr/pTyr-binding forkhead associated (FHA) protein